jgi:hypothetical protein
MSLATMTHRDSVIDLNHLGHYVHWGVIQISVANIVVIAAMIAVFVLALLLPFPKGHQAGER